MAVPTRTRALVFVAMALNFSGFAVTMLLLPRLVLQLGGSGLQLGLAFALYSLMQLVLVPLWGAVADRHGRRPVLLLSLAGSALSYALLAGAGTIELVWLSRILAGAFGADIAIFRTLAADLSPPEHRVRAMGRVGAAFSIGFIVGSSVAIQFGHLPAGTIAMIAAGCSLAALLLAVSGITETLAGAGGTPQPGGGPLCEAVAVARQSWEVLRAPLIPGLLLLLLVAGIAASHWESTFNLFVQRKPEFGYSMSEYGRLALITSLTLAFTQGFLAGWLERLLSGSILMTIGLLAVMAGMLTMAFATTHGLLVTGILAYALGHGLFMPAIFARVSLLSRLHRIATAQGLALAGGTLARTLTPPLAGWLLDQRLELPLLSGAALCLLALATVWRLPRLQR